MHEGAEAPSFLIVSTGFAGRAGRFFGASAQKNHFRSLAMQDESFHPAWSVSKTQFFDTQKAASEPRSGAAFSYDGYRL